MSSNSEISYPPGQSPEQVQPIKQPKAAAVEPATGKPGRKKAVPQ